MKTATLKTLEKMMPTTQEVLDACPTREEKINYLMSLTTEADFELFFSGTLRSASEARVDAD